MAKRFPYAFQCTKGHLKGRIFGFYSSKKKAREDASAMRCGRIKIIPKSKIMTSKRK